MTMEPAIIIQSVEEKVVIADSDFSYKIKYCYNALHRKVHPI